MILRRYIQTVALLALLGGPHLPSAYAENAQVREYTVKAAFLYNFIKFVDWPKEKMADANSPIEIGIMGKDPFGKAFEPLKDKTAKGRRIVIRRLKGPAELGESSGQTEAELQRQIEAAKKCHVLFVCRSEKKHLKELLERFKGQPVLTVGDCDGVLQAGGIINFVMEKQKVRFEINAAGARQTRLNIRSQLLRLARKVVK